MTKELENKILKAIKSNEPCSTSKMCSLINRNYYETQKKLNEMKKNKLIKCKKVPYGTKFRYFWSVKE